MLFIPAAETLEFLSKSAPQPWVKRMLLWMIFNGELIPYFRTGRSIAKARVWSIIHAELGDGVFSQNKDQRIRENFDPELAEKLITAKDTEEIEEIAHEWDAKDGPKDVSAGYFAHSPTIDWLSGTLEVVVFDDYSKELFWNEEELLNSNFRRADYSITLTGLCFDRSAIEMLQPTAELLPSIIRVDDGPARIGRPRSWDWDGATTHLLSIAQAPDGLPTGPGAQAQIERLLADWFSKSAGKEPAESLVRKHATKIMRALNKPESQ